MRDIAFLTGSLAVIALSLVAAPSPGAWRAGGGAALVLLWTYALVQASRGRLAPRSPVRLLPGHALLFLALGVAGAEGGLWAWAAVPPLTVALDLARHRSLAAPLYAILWLDLYALLHQVVALGRDLAGTALYLWSAGVGLCALLWVGRGARRIWTKGVIL